MELKGGYYEFIYNVKEKSWEYVRQLLYNLFKENKHYMDKYGVHSYDSYSSYEDCVYDFIKNNEAEIINDIQHDNIFKNLFLDIGVIGNMVIISVSLDLADEKYSRNYNFEIKYKQVLETPAMFERVNIADYFRCSILNPNDANYLDVLIPDLNVRYYN